jgi:hypothetical protein
MLRHGHLLLQQTFVAQLLEQPESLSQVTSSHCHQWSSLQQGGTSLSHHSSNQ